MLSKKLLYSLLILLGLSSNSNASDQDIKAFTLHDEVELQKELHSVLSKIALDTVKVSDLAGRTKSAHDNTRKTRWLKLVGEGRIINPEKGFVFFPSGTQKIDIQGYITSTLQNPNSVKIEGNNIVVKKAFLNTFRKTDQHGTETNISNFEIEINLQSVENELASQGLNHYTGNNAILIHSYPTE